LVVVAAAIEVAARKAVLTIVLTIVLAIVLPLAILAILAIVLPLTMPTLSNKATSSWCHRPDVVPIKATASAAAHSRIEFLDGTKPHVAARACSCCLRQCLVRQAPDATRLTPAPIIGAASHRSKTIHGIANLWLLISLRTATPISHQEVSGLAAVLAAVRLALRGMVVRMRVFP
jgi:hypothetical protein